MSSRKKITREELLVLARTNPEVLADIILPSRNREKDWNGALHSWKPGST